MKTTKNYWIGLFIIAMGIIMLIFGTHKDRTVGCASLSEYLLDNIGFLGGLCLGIIGLIVLSSGIILTEKK